MRDERPCDVVVRSLVCHAAVGMAAQGLASLARASDRPLHIVVHDDGSLEADDVERLRAALTAVTVVSREEADDLIEPRLARLPRSRAYRRGSALALKLFDLPLCAGATLAYCDADVVAFRSFAGLFEWPDAHVGAVFMPDCQNAYALRPWHLATERLSLAARVNTGVMLVRTAHYDLDFVEWLLGRDLAVFDRLPGWVEQTCWAALGERLGCHLYDEAHVRVIRDDRCLSDEALAIGHFTSSVRGLWRVPPIAAPGERIRLRTRPARALTGTDLAGDHLRRAVRRCRQWAMPQATSSRRSVPAPARVVTRDG